MLIPPDQHLAFAGQCLISFPQAIFSQLQGNLSLRQMIGRGLLFSLNTFERCCQRITFLADHLRHTGKVVCFFDSGNLALVQLVDTLMRTFLAALPEFGLTRDLT